MKNQITKNNRNIPSPLYSNSTRFKELYGYKLGRTLHFSLSTMWIVDIQEDLTKIYYKVYPSADVFREI